MSKNAEKFESDSGQSAEKHLAVIAMIAYIKEEAATFSADAAHLLDLAHEALARAANEPRRINRS